MALPLAGGAGGGMADLLARMFAAQGMRPAAMMGGTGTAGAPTSPLGSLLSPATTMPTPTPAPTPAPAPTSTTPPQAPGETSKLAGLAKAAGALQMLSPTTPQQVVAPGAPAPGRSLSNFTTNPNTLKVMMEMLGASPAAAPQMASLGALMRGGR